MTAYLTKRPDEVRAFPLSWIGLDAGETVAEDLGWLIVPQEIDPDALVLARSAFAPTRSVAVLSGGRTGHLYHVSARVRTSVGRILSQALMLRVVAA